jgi:hypothetical protein
MAAAAALGLANTWSRAKRMVVPPGSGTRAPFWTSFWGSALYVCWAPVQAARAHEPSVTADEESFTAVVRHAGRSMTSTQVTATSSLDAIAAYAAAHATLHTLNLPGRQRHSRRAQKARPKFPHATATKTTVTGKPQVTVFAPGFG